MAKHRFEITEKEILLAIAFAVMGFLLTMKPFLMFLDSNNPIVGLAIYYAIIYGALLILSHFKLIIHDFEIDTPWKTLGVLCIFFAFFITVNWESAYINQIVAGTSTGVSNIYFGSEDGAVYYFWNTIMNVTNIEYARLLTYVLTPFLLVLLGSMLVEEKIEFSGYMG